jgi:Tfp pilus assembly protein PilO
MRKPKIIFIIAITALIISGLIFSLYVKSKISSIKSLRASINELQKSSNLTMEEENTEAIRNLKELFPEKENITKFIESAYRISKARSIKNFTFEQKSRESIDLASGKILKVMPAQGQRPKVIYSYPIKISFNAGYRNTAEFIRGIQNQNRLATLDSLLITSDNEYLAVEMVVTIYSMEEM